VNQVRRFNKRLLSVRLEPFLICLHVESDMWKLVVGFIIFAGLALYMLSRGGDIDLSGEKHGGLNPSSSVVNADGAG
jgi:hypothetical protein